MFDVIVSTWANRCWLSGLLGSASAFLASSRRLADLSKTSLVRSIMASRAGFSWRSWTGMKVNKKRQVSNKYCFNNRNWIILMRSSTMAEWFRTYNLCVPMVESSAHWFLVLLYVWWNLGLINNNNNNNNNNSNQIYGWKHEVVGLRSWVWGRGFESCPSHPWSFVFTDTPSL